MTKLYYTDARIASLMAEKFGVEFSSMDYTFTYPCQAVPNKHYIHSDSYHIFEPWDYDRNVSGAMFFEGEWRHDLKNGTYTEVALNQELHTQQRNNTAFFMPVKEKDSDSDND